MPPELNVISRKGPGHDASRSPPKQQCSEKPVAETKIDTKGDMVVSTAMMLMVMFCVVTFS